MIFVFLTLEGRALKWSFLYEMRMRIGCGFLFYFVLVFLLGQAKYLTTLYQLPRLMEMLKVSINK